MLERCAGNGGRGSRTHRAATAMERYTADSHTAAHLNSATFEPPRQSEPRQQWSGAPVPNHGRRTTTTDRTPTTTIRAATVMERCAGDSPRTPATGNDGCLESCPPITIPPAMPGAPLAYFLTFGTYGSRLHGDARGTVDRNHRVLGEDPLPRDDFRRGFELRGMKGEAFSISPAARTVLERTFREVCEFRDWQLMALNIRTEHIHAVVAADASPLSVLHTLKAYGTRALRARRIVGADSQVWARHGSTEYAWNEDDVAAVVEYTLNRQGADLPGSDRRNWEMGGAD